MSKGLQETSIGKNFLSKTPIAQKIIPRTDGTAWNPKFQHSTGNNQPGGWGKKQPAEWGKNIFTSLLTTLQYLISEYIQNCEKKKKHQKAKAIQLINGLTNWTGFSLLHSASVQSATSYSLKDSSPPLSCILYYCALKPFETLSRAGFFCPCIASTMCCHSGDKDIYDSA